MQKNQLAFSLIECMIALSLGLFLCTGIFSLFHTLEVLHRREIAMSQLHTQMRFMTQFLREKIHMAGNGSCVATSEKLSSSIIQIFDSDAAQRSLGVLIKPETQLLLLQECIRFHDQLQYLPVAFFIADTHRVNCNKKNINALFIKVGNHRREELITGVIDFQLHLYPDLHQEKSVAAVGIDYLLTSVDDVLKNPQTYWFHGNTVTASDHALYQSGIVYAAVQRQLP